MITEASRQVWVPSGGTSARGQRALTMRVAPGARSNSARAAMHGRKSPGYWNWVPAKPLEWNVTTKCCAAPAPALLRTRAWNQLSWPYSGDWCVVPPSSALRIHRSGESQKVPPHSSAPGSRGVVAQPQVGRGRRVGQPVDEAVEGVHDLRVAGLAEQELLDHGRGDRVRPSGRRRGPSSAC